MHPHLANSRHSGEEEQWHGKFLGAADSLANSAHEHGAAPGRHADGSPVPVSSHKWFCDCRVWLGNLRHCWPEIHLWRAGIATVPGKQDGRGYLGDEIQMCVASLSHLFAHKHSLQPCLHRHLQLRAAIHFSQKAKSFPSLCSLYLHSL